MNTETYTARARKWEHGWELHIENLGVTQSRTLRDAEQTVRSYVTMSTGRDSDTFEVEVVPDIGEVAEEIAQARTANQVAEQEQRKAAFLYRSAVLRMRDDGLTGQDISTVLGVSPQRVSQLLIEKPGSVAETVEKVEKVDFLTPKRRSAREKI